MAWDEESGLGAIVICDSEDAIEAIRGREFDDEVHSDSFKWKSGAVGSDGVMGDVGTGCKNLGGLTGGTATDKGGDIVLHVGPPVVSRKEKAGFKNTGVTGGGGVMV